MLNMSNNNNFSSLVKTLKTTPYGTQSHSAAFDKLHRKYLSKKHFGEFILCSAGRFNTENKTNDFMRQSGIVKLSGIEGQPMSVLSTLSKPSTEKSVFDTDFYFLERELAEYNLDHLQVNVNAIITNETMDKFILLRTLDHELKLVGGHVDFDPSDYHISMNDTLLRNMKKEMEEEVKKSSELLELLPNEPTFKYLADANTGVFYDLLHTMYVYLIVCDVDKIFEKIKSGEPDKHKVVVMTADEILRYDRKKSMVTDLIKYFQQ